MVVLLIVDKYMTVTHPKSYVQITNNVTTPIKKKQKKKTQQITTNKKKRNLNKN